MFIPQYFSDLSNGFKLCLNELKLRRQSIINENTFRFSGSVDETEKLNEEKNCKCHCLFVFKVKGCSESSYRLKQKELSDI